TLTWDTANLTLQSNPHLGKSNHHLGKSNPHLGKSKPQPGESKPHLVEREREINSHLEESVAGVNS
ncbi:MAG: hypothetical protein ACK56F_19970, partial [bacterium]